MPISISALNTASKCLMRSSPVFNAGNGNAAVVASKSFTSYNKPSQLYHDMYSQAESRPETPDLPRSLNDLKVSNNGAGSVVTEEMTYVDNANDDTYSIPDSPFIPTVSTDEYVSGNGHRTL